MRLHIDFVARLIIVALVVGVYGTHGHKLLKV